MSEPWSGADIKRLKYLYPALSQEELAIAFFPRSHEAIRGMAKSLGLRRRKRDWKAIAANHSPIFVFEVRP